MPNPAPVLDIDPIANDVGPSLRLVRATEVSTSAEVADPRVDVLEIASSILGYDVQSIATSQHGDPDAARHLDRFLIEILGYPVLTAAEAILDQLAAAASMLSSQDLAGADDEEASLEQADVTRALLASEIETLSNDESPDT